MSPQSPFIFALLAVTSLNSVAAKKVKGIYEIIILVLDQFCITENDHDVSPSAREFDWLEF